MNIDTNKIDFKAKVFFRYIKESSFNDKRDNSPRSYSETKPL